MQTIALFTFFNTIAKQNYRIYNPDIPTDKVITSMEVHLRDILVNLAGKTEFKIISFVSSERNEVVQAMVNSEHKKIGIEAIRVYLDANSFLITRLQDWKIHIMPDPDSGIEKRAGIEMTGDVGMFFLNELKG